MLILNIQTLSILSGNSSYQSSELAVLLSDVNSGTLLDLLDLFQDFLLGSVTSDSHLLVVVVDNDLIDSYICNTFSVNERGTNVA